MSHRFEDRFTDTSDKYAVDGFDRHKVYPGSFNTRCNTPNNVKTQTSELYPITEHQG